MHICNRNVWHHRKPDATSKLNWLSLWLYPALLMLPQQQTSRTHQHCIGKKATKHNTQELKPEGLRKIAQAEQVDMLIWSDQDRNKRQKYVGGNNDEDRPGSVQGLTELPGVYGHTD